MCRTEGDLTFGAETTHPIIFCRVDLPIHSTISVSVGRRLKEVYKGTAACVKAILS